MDLGILKISDFNNAWAPFFRIPQNPRLIGISFFSKSQENETIGFEQSQSCLVPIVLINANTLVLKKKKSRWRRRRELSNPDRGPSQRTQSISAREALAVDLDSIFMMS